MRAKVIRGTIQLISPANTAENRAGGSVLDEPGQPQQTRCLRRSARTGEGAWGVRGILHCAEAWVSLTGKGGRYSMGNGGSCVFESWETSVPAEAGPGSEDVFGIQNEVPWSCYLRWANSTRIPESRALERGIDHGTFVVFSFSTKISQTGEGNLALAAARSLAQSRDERKEGRGARATCELSELMD
ncbi:hypothetical protein B0H17DRAFT_1147877 [Mycena rosella]|uniref:Uncharacterized protein n=1 Tax=Mycena rosella TaxID=1033263 RepID=A0AAD7CH97_MYCRO|nr:hypothetical protein B0H17DRAFT_1147877 [Mycena rosella]